MTMNDDNIGRSRMLPPLPERMRPHDLDGYVGQRHLIGEGCILRNMIESGNLSSFILWGPPGVGKTTLSRIVAKSLNREFFTLSAVSAGVKDVRDVIEKARSNSLFSNGLSPILFIDEIHRFNKSQQDALLGAVEDGTIVLIGATTENPSFEVITPLLSRCQVFVLKSLEKSDLQQLLDRALKKDEVLKYRNITVNETDALFRYAAGDARKLLNILEIVVGSFTGGKPVVIDNKVVTSCLQENTAIYDKGGEMHYDVISAFIKSVRGSDPNAAVYYLARMLYAGESVTFIARRMMICASEDVGNADPQALVVATSAAMAVERVGMPEAQIILAQAASYIAMAPKSNSAVNAISAAMETVTNSKTYQVPTHLMDAHYKGAAKLGHGEGYKYPHVYPNHYVEQQYLPTELAGTVFYEPSDNGYEKKLKEYWSEIKESNSDKE